MHQTIWTLKGESQWLLKGHFSQTCSTRVFIFVCEEMSPCKRKVRIYKVLHCWRCWKKMKAHYGDPLWGDTLYYFWGGVHVSMYPISNFWKNFIIFLHIILEYNLGKIVILCIKKQKYIFKIIQIIFNLWKLKVYWITSFHIVWITFGYCVINSKKFMSKSENFPPKMQ
jgi:hypothetical protein